MTEEAEVKPIAQIVSPKEREKFVELDWPVEFDGQTYNKIRVRRATGVEVEEFIEATVSAAPGAPAPKAPMIDCPTEVYEALDDDDLFKVEEAMRPFMPRRLQTVMSSILGGAETTPEK